MNYEDILIACKIGDWYSTDTIIEHELDLSLGIMFADGRITFYNGSILEFTESITPDRFKYRYQYINTKGNLIFRYDNVPHHREIATFPDHKHQPDKVVESESIDLRQAIEEIITIIVDEDEKIP